MRGRSESLNLAFLSIDFPNDNSESFSRFAIAFVCELSRPTMPLSMEEKKLLLSLILEGKAILFGSFSTSLTKEGKLEAWKGILEKCRNVYGFDPVGGRGWKYLRDGVWNNIKMVAMRKFDRNKRTGAGGGSVAQLNETDKIVMEIVGKESPLVRGLPVADIGEDPESDEDLSDDDEGTTTRTESHPSRKRRHAPLTKKEQEQELFELKKTRMEVEIQEKKLNCIIQQFKIEKLRN